MQLQYTNENAIRRVDSTGRIIIPKGVRDKFNIQEGDDLEFYSFESDEKNFIGMCKARETFADPRYEIALAVLEEFGYEAPQELIEKMGGKN